LLEDAPRAEDLPRLKQRVMEDRFLRGQIIGAAARHSVVVVQTAQMSERNNARVADEVRRIAARHDSPEFKVLVAGMPALTTGLNDLVIRDMARTCGLAFLAVLVVLIFIFRHPMGVIGPITVVAIAVISTAGLMAATDVPMTMVTNIMPVLLVCVGIGESVHMQSVFHDARGRGLNNHDAVVYTLATSAVPCIFTTLTTAFGLLSFRAAQLQGLQQMGMYGCFGVVMAGFGALVLLPIVLSFSPASFSKRWDVNATTESALARFTDRLVLYCLRLSRPERTARGALSFRRRNFVLAFHAGLLVLAVVSMGSLKFYHNPADWVPASTEVARAFHALNDNVGGASNVVLLVDSGKAGGLKDPDLLLRMSRLEEHIRAYRHGPERRPIVDNTTSVVELLRRGSRAMHGGDAAFDKVPSEPQAVADLFGFYENAAPEQLRRFVTVDAQRGMMLVQVRWLDALAYEPLTAHIQTGIDRYIGSAAVVKPTGTVFNMCSVVHFLLRDQITSFGSGMAAIAVLMVIVLRELKLGLLGMIPNVLPILLLLGFMGLTGIPVDAITLLVASISIGIAVDDTIRWWHRFRIEYRHSGDVEQAIATSLEHTGRGTVFTSVIVACGFGVFLSASLSNARLFGALCSFGVLLALFADLVLGPAVLRAAYKNTKITANAAAPAAEAHAAPRAAPEGS
ncbi:MAG TPA: MMPL family transporter, partial [Polyangiaceae bacterium]|nr:MMPL family transporter [Polyangiaceae bacterium]